jgi:DNA-binding transcriptional LysR family regulator
MWPSGAAACPIRAWWPDGWPPARLSLVEVTGRFSANTMQARLKAVLAGLGIGLLPDTLMQQSLSAGRLVQVLPGHGQSGGGFHVV